MSESKVVEFKAKPEQVVQSSQSNDYQFFANFTITRIPKNRLLRWSIEIYIGETTLVAYAITEHSAYLMAGRMLGDYAFKLDRGAA